MNAFYRQNYSQNYSQNYRQNYRPYPSLPSWLRILWGWL